ncbi:uncharacterized protein LOC112350481 [Selaginella moellendorffii]|uniref:uncharacterized protein LOC112350481 n=1 Tax=Selaginella moellendorffii TaxID=88036 RepID=UPI000D1D10C5|nr:uncharacterized protein LOC112350481 [Selaginella moellendorffii]|eukprot:XP_024542542.1 uncharacterized protein LOC112350481 [Selaginella moellendorffii]
MASSYLRLAVHRVAQHYYLITSVIDSNVEGCRIIVRKSGENKFPSIRLADIPVAADGGSNSNTKFVIKQRPQASFISGGDSSGAASGSGSNASKSMEERNEEYNKARARIFRHEQEQRAYDELLEVEKRKTAKVIEVRESASTPEQGRQRMNAGSGSNSCSSSSSSSGGSGSKADKDQSSKSRQKVAIFRDREKDRKDPDYDRNYDRYKFLAEVTTFVDAFLCICRYSQRFDPGFGLNQPPAFGMQARYTPVVNYNTEFPQLGCPPVRQMPPQVTSQSGWRHAYQQHQDMMRAPAPFNPPPPRVSPHTNMATYMSQYPYPRPSMAYHYSSQVSQCAATLTVFVVTPQKPQAKTCEAAASNQASKQGITQSFEMDMYEACEIPWKATQPS